MEHVVFCYDSKMYACSLAPGLCCCPFSIVHSNHSTVFAVHLAFNYALFFGFDLNHLGPLNIAFGAICDKEIRHIHGVFAGYGIPVRYGYAFTSPLDHCIVFVTKSHEWMFPSWPVSRVVFTHILAWVCELIQPIGPATHANTFLAV